MRRRDFLRHTSLATTALMVPGFLRAARLPGRSNGRRLVVLQLSGGNDALNTVVPWRNDAYYAARRGIALPVDKVLRLTDGIALNPALAPLRPLFDEGRMTLVNGVGYPNPDRSHFRSMDIWHTASASNEHLATGWLGRFLDSECRHADEVIEFGPRLSLANTGAVRKAISLTDPARFHAATREPYFAGLAADQGTIAHAELGYLYKTMAETYESADRINAHYRLRESTASYPKTELGRAFRDIATFIANGMGTRVYYASATGFDTHNNQVARQARALGTVADALAAFVKDMKAQGLLDDTLVMVFSEFGRRVKANASNGTDHGTAGSMWLLGSKGRGVFNDVPSLTDLDANGDVGSSVDFRSVYASLLEQWLGVPANEVLPSSIRPVEGLI